MIGVHSFINSFDDHMNDVQARAKSPMTKIRCMGSGHSWTNLFADDGSWLMDTSGINEIVWSPDNPYQVRMKIRVRIRMRI